MTLNSTFFFRLILRMMHSRRLWRGRPDDRMQLWTDGQRMRVLWLRMGAALLPIPHRRSPMLTRIVQPSSALETFLGSLDLDLSQPQSAHLLQLVDGLLVCDESKTLAALQHQFLDSTDPSNRADFLRISPRRAEEVRTAL